MDEAEVDDVVSGLFVGVKVTGTLPGVVVSGLFFGVEVTGTLLDVVTGYTVTEVRTGQWVTSGGHSVLTVPPEAVIVGRTVPLLTGYGALVVKIVLEVPLDALLVVKELVVETSLLVERSLLVDVVVLAGADEGGIDEDPVPNGVVELETVLEFQMPVLLVYVGIEDDPVPIGAVGPGVVVEFQMPVLLVYVGIEDDPVPVGAVGPGVVVEFQMPELLVYVGKDAEAEAIALEDELDDDEVMLEDVAVEEAVDEVDVEELDEEVVTGLAQSQSVN
ncbi:MAG: hypothetical protein Q9222_006545 [Ikaeria aurantiellina]